MFAEPVANVADLASLALLKATTYSDFPCVREKA
jgi:hypothetical protein